MSRRTRRKQRLSDADRARLGAYVAHFNARDFDAIRAMISDDVRLDLVSRTHMRGKAEVSRYFGNYAKVSDWRLVPGLVEGHPAILVFDPNAPDAGPKYFMLLGWSAGKVATIRDFRHAPYAIDGAEYRSEPAPGATIVALATGTIVLAIPAICELWCRPLGV